MQNQIPGLSEGQGHGLTTLLSCLKVGREYLSRVWCSERMGHMEGTWKNQGDNLGGQYREGFEGQAEDLGPNSSQGWDTNGEFLA